MKNKKYVYIASPYTIGDVGLNVKVQLDAYKKLSDLGYYVYSPLWSHFQHIFHPESYDFWLDVCIAWLEKCDCVLRLEGKSKGADIEVKHAKKLGIPVFYDMNDIKI